MENQVEAVTYVQLREIMQVLETNEAITGDTKVFIDTGWDSVQEVASDAVSIEKVVKFTVVDVLTNESFAGYSLEEKAEKMDAEGDPGTAIIIRNLYQKSSFEQLKSRPGQKCIASSNTQCWFYSRQLSGFEPGAKIQSDFCPRLICSK